MEFNLVESLDDSRFDITDRPTCLAAPKPTLLQLEQHLH
jgi:hypothetical protein